MTSKLQTELRDVRARLKERMGADSALTSVSDWIQTHTTLNDAPFSFKDHEYQRFILDDSSRPWLPKNQHRWVSLNCRSA